MIDHVTLRVADIDATRRFYTAVLAPLGHDVGFTTEEEPRWSEWGDFSAVQRGEGEPVAAHVHIAFAATSTEQVDAFWQAGIDAGFESNGAPGERAHYHPGYYGAFLIDPDGHNVEAVFHDRSVAG